MEGVGKDGGCSKADRLLLPRLLPRSSLRLTRRGVLQEDAKSQDFTAPRCGGWGGGEMSTYANGLGDEPIERDCIRFALRNELRQLSER